MQNIEHEGVYSSSLVFSAGLSSDKLFKNAFHKHIIFASFCKTKLNKNKNWQLPKSLSQDKATDCHELSKVSTAQ